jgi:hypothetical protein
VPAAHSKQEVCPVLGWYLPAAQLVQDDAPLPLNFPVAQGAHDVWPALD